jgi:hypothetical protein
MKIGLIVQIAGIKMISMLTKIKRKLCKHPFNKCNFALIADRSYTYCTKCGKTWETTRKGD